MFSYFSKIIRYNKLKNKNAKAQNVIKQKDSRPLSSNLENNLKAITNTLGASDDIIIREFTFGGNEKVNGAILFLNGMVDKDNLEKVIMKSLLYDASQTQERKASDMSDIGIIQKSLLSSSDVKRITTLDTLFDYFLSGSTVLLIDGSNEALIIDEKKWEKRNIANAETENVVRGPREGFTETLAINITMLRRKIKNPNLRFESFTIGEQTRTSVCISYINGIVNPKLITEIKERLNKIKIDAILESGYIEAFIEDAPYSIFSTVGNSEKPDTVAGKILEGRAAIFVDGTPFVLTVPMLFIESFQSAEDYYSRPYLASFIRILRFYAYFIAIMAPGIYVALTTFHQELIPTLLLFTIAAGHEGVPFPAVLEATIMLITFDILREAGVRLPRPIGSAVSIVGALVIGESAVSAGLIGPFMVIIVSLTAIASFVVPAQTDSASLLRYFILILAGFMGGLGILMGIMIVLIHLASLRSFGTPYFSPIAPLTLKDIKDVFIRAPIWKMKTRPRLIGGHNGQRETSNASSTPNNEESNNKS